MARRYEDIAYFAKKKELNPIEHYLSASTVCNGTQKESQVFK